MKINNPFKALFAGALILTLIGAFFKINHWPYAQVMLIIGLLSSLSYIILGIIEVNKSTTIKPLEKLLWTAGFISIALTFITAVLYLAFGRKRIV
jgi:hypothetical protein